MLKGAGWYGRKVTVTMILLILLILIGLGLSRISFGAVEDSGSRILSVIIEHYGIDSFEMERTISIPLEEGLADVAGISKMRSTSEYGRTRVDCSLKGGHSYEEVYLAVRGIVDRVYEELPDSVQRPRIFTGSSSLRPVFIVSFHSREAAYTLEELRSYVEKEVKPLFERIDGTGEIEVGGGSIREIHIEIDGGKTAASGTSPGEIAEMLRKSMVLLPAGYIRTRNSELPVSIRAKPDSIEEIAELNIRLPGGSMLPLSALGTVRFGCREPDTVSRVGGSRRVVLYIRSNGRTNVGTLGTRCSEIAESLSLKGVETEVIFNGGERIRKSLRQMFTAVLFGMGIVALTFAAAARDIRRIVVLTCFLPLSLAAACALLAALSVDFDHYTLAGLALGLGLIIDIGIVLSAHLYGGASSPSSSGLEKVKTVREILRPLFSSVLTTLIVLVPFFFIKDSVPGSLQIASSLSVLMMTALCLALLFLPAYLKPGASSFTPRTGRRNCLRFVYATIRFFMRRKFFLAAAPVLIMAAAAAAVSMGTDFTEIWSEDILFGHVEFESGSTLRAADIRLRALSEAVETIRGVELVETIARRGSGEISIRFSGELTDKTVLIWEIGKIAGEIPGCFVYFPEKIEKGERTLEISLTGDDQRLLKSIARSTAARLQKAEPVKEVVLHFKNDPPAYIFQVDHAKATYSGVLPGQIADLLRWAVYGPVAFKWMDGEGETDIRILGKGKSSLSRADLSDLHVSSGGGTVLPILRLGRFIESTEASKIYRENNRRAVYFTVHSVNRNIEEMLETIWDILDGIDLPKGYAFRIDKKIYEFRDRVRNLVLLLILVAVLVFMVLAAQFESFSYPLVIIALIPLSLSFPLLGLFLIGRNLTVPVLLGLIMMTGVIVNNGILIADSIRRRGASSKAREAETAVSSVILAVRKRMNSLVLSSVTTILGTVPLFFVSGEGSGFMKSIAFVVIFGMSAAVLVTFTLLPAMFSFFGGKKARNRIY